MKNFRTYHIAVEFYRRVRSTVAQQLPCHLREQLLRAASSIPLNLAEGGGRATKADQRKFFVIAFGSLKECQSIFDISEILDSEMMECSDKLGAHLYKLIKGTK